MNKQQHIQIDLYYERQIFYNISLKMRSHTEPQLSTESVIESYKQLSSQDPETRYRANQFLLSLSLRDEAWQITQSMLNNVQDVNFQFLGTQILYQKVSNQLTGLSVYAKKQLREFIFTKLEDPSINYVAIIDKLASIGALIACATLLNGWPTFIKDIIGFMAKSQHNLKSGLFVLERVPEQLRNINKIASGLKNAIIDQMLKNENQMAEVFNSILGMYTDNLLIKKCLQAMQSWAKCRFNFLKYTELIKKVLLHSLQSLQKFESGIVMVVQTIKGASTNRFGSALSEWQPTAQLTKYQGDEIESIKLLIQFILQNKKNFLGQNVQPEHVDMYLQIIKNSLLSFGFLITQNIGFDMLDIIMYFTQSSDLRTSQGTFQFWFDFSQKVSKCKVDVQVKQRFAKYVQEVFDVVGKKVLVDSDALLDDPDLKEDITIDDINAMSFSEYRRQTTILYKQIYDYYLSQTGSPQYYFDKCFAYIGDEANGLLGRFTQLALFCIKSAIQSMITQADAEYICKILSFVIGKGTNVYPRIAAQTLLLIRDCSRQIKRNTNLCHNALNYSLYFLKDQKICHYAADAFKILMQTITTISDTKVVQNMLQYYNSQQFPSEQIIDKIIEGIFSTITKMDNSQAIDHYITKFVQIVLGKFQKVHGNLGNFGDKPYLIPIKEMKTILQNFQAMGKQFQVKYTVIYKRILDSSLKMITIVIPYSLKQSQNYVKFNQLGLSCSIYKLALKLCQQDITQQFLTILDQTLSVLTKQTIINMCPVLQLLCYTLTHFVPNVGYNFNQWLNQRMVFINQFFLSYMEPIALADVDVIRYYFQIQECLLLYNCQIYLAGDKCLHIFQLALYVLRHINQPKMQRKVVNFIYICCQLPEVFASRSQKIVQTIITSIPTSNSICHHNMSRIFLLTAPKIQNLPQLLSQYLHMNPYEGLSEDLIKLIVKLILLVLDPNSGLPQNNRERNFMMIIKDLYELAKTGENPNKSTQLEFRLTLWSKNKGLAADDD